MPSLGNDMRREEPGAPTVSLDVMPRGSSTGQSPLHFADGGGWGEFSASYRVQQAFKESGVVDEGYSRTSWVKGQETRRLFLIPLLE